MDAEKQLEQLLDIVEYGTETQATQAWNQAITYLTPTYNNENNHPRYHLQYITKYGKTPTIRDQAKTIKNQYNKNQHTNQ